MKVSKQIMRISKCKLVIVLLVVIFFEGFIDPEMGSLDEIVRWIFGYVNLSKHNLFVMSLMKLLIPQIAILFLWGDFIQENLGKNYQFIFTRTRKTHKVLRKFIVQLLINGTITTIFMEALIVLLYLIKGCKVEGADTLIGDLAIYCIYMNCLLLLVNGLSLAINSIYGVLVALVLQMISFEAIFYIFRGDASVRPKLYYFCPTSPIMFIENAGITAMTKIIWSIGLISITVIFYIVACVYIRRKEFI